MVEKIARNQMRCSGFDYDSESISELFLQAKALMWTPSLGVGSGSVLLFLFPVAVVVCQQQPCHLGEVYGQLKGGRLLRLSP